MLKRYFNAKIVKDHHLESGELWVFNKKIVNPHSRGDEEVNLNGAIVAPGYIDVQINGCFGFDFASEPHKVAEAAELLPKYGVTSFLPTIVSSTPDQYKSIVPVLQGLIDNSISAHILGIHLEGPFLNRGVHGAHKKDVLQSFENLKNLEEVYGSLDGIKIITLAPEIHGALQWIPEIIKRNILVSCGHSLASFDDFQKASAVGLKLVTHLFNAMSSFHHRYPGVIGSVLSSHDINYTIIADGVHVHPAVLKMAWNSNPKGLILVSDGMAAMGLPDGIYRLGNMRVVVSEGIACIEGTSTLAGSVAGLDAAVRMLHRSTGCSQVEAIEAASVKPAQLLNMESTKGHLGVGADADFVVLNDELEVLQTYVSGVLAYSKNNKIDKIRTG